MNPEPHEVQTETIRYLLAVNAEKGEEIRRLTAELAAAQAELTAAMRGLGTCRRRPIFVAAYGRLGMAAALWRSGGSGPWIPRRPRRESRSRSGISQGCRARLKLSSPICRIPVDA